MKRGTLKIIRQLVVVVAVIAIATISVRAVDRYRGGGAGGDAGPCPVDMVLVQSSGGTICVDRYEASAGADCPYPDPQSQVQSRTNIDTPGCAPVAAGGGWPWRFLSQNQAALACAKAGKRLPTNKEWLQAALGTPDPAGSWGSEDCQVAKNWTAQPGNAGSGTKCVSPAGVYDMIGNVWEWVDGTAVDGVHEGRMLPESGYVRGVDERGIPSATDPQTGDENYYFDRLWLKKSGVRGLARGGYWENGQEAGAYSLYIVAEPSYVGTGVGFRCVKEPI